MWLVYYSVIRKATSVRFTDYYLRSKPMHLTVVGVGRIFFQRGNFPGGRTMVKFHFTNSKLKEKHIFTKTLVRKFSNFKMQGLVPFPTPTLAPITYLTDHAIFCKTGCIYLRVTMCLTNTDKPLCITKFAFLVYKIWHNNSNC